MRGNAGGAAVWNQLEVGGLPSCCNFVCSRTKFLLQVVTQIQQELFTLRAQVAEESGLADAVRTINNLATAQVRKETPSLVDVIGSGRPKEFIGREEETNSGQR